MGVVNYKDYKKSLEGFILTVIEEGASDIHLTAERHPFIRINGTLIPLTKSPVLTKDDALGFASILMRKRTLEHFIDMKEMDFSFKYNKDVRFRGNAFFQKGVVALVLRAISNDIRTIEELSLPPILEIFARKKQGFFLVVGPVGEGKSTTLAAMINLINKERAEHCC